MLKIEDLHASINGKEILKGINLEVKPGEVQDRKSTRLNSSHTTVSRMPSSA